MPIEPRSALPRTIKPWDQTPSHILWTGALRNSTADARNAVLHGDKTIDRSPCGTGTSPRVAQLAAKERSAPSGGCIHMSITGTHCEGRVETAAEACNPPVHCWLGTSDGDQHPVY